MKLLRKYHYSNERYIAYISLSKQIESGSFVLTCSGGVN